MLPAQISQPSLHRVWSCRSHAGQHAHRGHRLPTDADSGVGHVLPHTACMQELCTLVYLCSDSVSPLVAVLGTCMDCAEGWVPLQPSSNWGWTCHMWTGLTCRDTPLICKRCYGHSRMVCEVSCSRKRCRRIALTTPVSHRTTARPDGSARFFWWRMMQNLEDLPVYVNSTRSLLTALKGCGLSRGWRKCDKNSAFVISSSFISFSEIASIGFSNVSASWDQIFFWWR